LELGKIMSDAELTKLLTQLRILVDARKYEEIGDLLIAQDTTAFIGRVQATSLATSLIQKRPAASDSVSLLKPDMFLTRIQDPAAFLTTKENGPYIIGQELDLLEKRIDVSVNSLCNKIINWSVKKRKKIAIVAACRNEGPWLLEWIAFHRAAGVQGSRSTPSSKRCRTGRSGST
jgi:hypothetical protein